MMSDMRTKDRVRRYAKKHPGKTVREIQTALGISSPSVVHFHLKPATKTDKITVLSDALSRIMACTGSSTEAHHIAAAALASID